MKDAFKNKKVYIVAAIALVVAALVVTIWDIIALNSDNGFLQPEMVVWAFAIIYVLIGYVAGDMVVVRYRRKEGQYDGKVPDEIRINAWIKRLEFFIPAILLFIAAITFDIIAVTTGTYPLGGNPYTPRLK